MLQLMIVDDEPIAVNYLTEVLREAEQLDIEITKAYSGAQAIERMGNHKVDILLTDIRMPGMSGMELADYTLRRWPRCRVIFLTGYDDFTYAQTAIRKGGVDYVLKTEGDEVIIAALHKAIEDIHNEMNEELVLQKARQQLHLALPLLRRDYLIEFVQGDVDSTAHRMKRFKELHIDLDPQMSVLIAVGRIDEWGSFALPADKPLLQYAVHNIAEEYISTHVRFVAIHDDRTRFIWLIQPKSSEGNGAWEDVGNWLIDGAELIQNTSKRLLKVPISLALATVASPWEQISERIETLKLQLSCGIGRGKEMLLTELQMGTPQPISRSSQAFFAENELRSNIRKLDLLEAYMDNGEKESFAQLIAELFPFNDLEKASSENGLLILELFNHLSAFFLSYMNKRKLFTQLGAVVQPEKLSDMYQHASWKEAFQYFAELGKSLAEYNGRRQVERTNDIIGKIHQYVSAFLHEELSLTKLSELVYLSPPYLSRLYKQMTGQGLLEYITEIRISKAKVLLKTTSLKIHEIAAQVGLESAPYFTRLFKKATGYTPQEYRDSAKSKDD
jgi:two-component system response regulator YesN